ncbi:uncharacterized protein MKK02DRAFT_29534 [Dioszegia hungarica]|uniref:PIN domain-containing protein n=1 Tax=Dioszegia hungarica TaxID=4972 RepID=A0AA38LYS9_9TREE|nr:uncharacterized protein MKK02DRAFT_29534 [Dioszegia hungarica]KAI9639481.1 hypothetical protein MKK02DRAFT_29534 [Dioszegia hungarica]
MWSGSYLAQLEAADEVRAARWEDVDMEAAEYIANHQEYEQPEMRTPTRSQAVGTGSHRYLTLDTNVLINHLNLVQKLDKLASQAHTEQSSTVSSQSTRPDTLAAARQATTWLLAVNRHRRETGYGAVRCQRWSERGAQRLSKADDRVLDCALYFREQGGGNVMLWTEDRNLSLLAEANDISTIPSPTPDLTCILHLCGIPFDRTSDLPPQEISTPEVEAEEDGMQIEADLVSPPLPPSSLPAPIATSTPVSLTTRPRRTQSSSSSPSTSTSRPSFAFKDASSPLPSRIPRPTARVPVPTDVLARLTHLARLIRAALPSSSPSSNPSPAPSSNPPTPLSTQNGLNRLITALRLLSPPDGNTDATRQLYRLLSALMTLSAWVRPPSDVRERRVLNNEAAGAVRVAMDALPELGVGVDEGELQELAGIIRVL